jgi:uncharacterized protein (DUF362 family)
MQQRDVNPIVLVRRGGLKRMTTADLADAADRLALLPALTKASRIVIKVNLAGATRYGPESGANVSPHAILALVQSIRGLNPKTKIAVAEADSAGADAQAYRKFEAVGYNEALAREEDVELLDLSRCAVEPVTPSFRSPLGNPFLLGAPILHCDLFISVSKIKTHNMTGVTGVLKNQFGSLPVSDKSVYHPWLAEAIRDVNLARPPDLGIADGDPAMEGDGPVRGKAVPLGLHLIGGDPVAVDTVMTRLIGIEPARIDHIQLSSRAGLGVSDEGSIRVDREASISLIRPFAFIPREQSALIESGLRLQGFGLRIARAGHRLHGLRSLGQLRRIPGALMGLAGRR